MDFRLPKQVPSVALIVLVAAVLRLKDLDQPLNDVFSWREASTAMMADNFWQHSWNIFYPEVSWTGPGPSYQGREFQVVSYITALFYAVFGWHPALGRLVAVCFGLLGVFALHRLLARIWGSRYADAGALVLAMLPGAVVLDREFLPDPAMLSLVITGLWLFVVYLQTDRFWLLPVSAAILTLGILAKLPGLTVVAPCVYAALHTLKGREDARRRMLLLAITGVLFALPIVAYYSWAIHLGKTYPPYHIAGGGYIWERGALMNFWREGFYLSDLAIAFNYWFLTQPLLLLVLVGILSPVLYRKEHEGRPFRWLAHVWLGACLLLYAVAMEEIAHNTQNLLVLAAPAAMVAADGLLMIARTTGRSLRKDPDLVRLVLMIVIVLAASREGIAVIKNPRAADGVELGTRLAALSAPTDLVITGALQYGDPIAIYYSRRRGWIFPPYGFPGPYGVFTDDETAIRILEDLRKQGARWFAVTKDAADASGEVLFVKHHAGLLAYLDRTAAQVENNDRLLIYRLSAP